MKYKLIEDHSNTEMTYEDIIFKNRGMEYCDQEQYIYSTEENLLDYDLLDNMQEGCKLLNLHIEQDSPIAIIVDCDADGFTSSATLLNYLTDAYPGKELNITPLLHAGKEHGLSADIIIPEGTKLVILPDAGSNDYKQHEELHKQGIDVLVLDHHEADGGYSKFATVINNQLSDGYTNKSLTGAGVVYQFIRAYNKNYGIQLEVKNYLDLVALGLIADMADVRDLETRYLIRTGLTNIKTPIMQEMIDAQAFSLKGSLDQIGVSFNIAPLINGMIRSGTEKEKEFLFFAFCKQYTSLLVQSTKRGAVDGDTETYGGAAVRISKNVKARADKANNGYVDKIKDLIFEQNLLKNKLLVVTIGDIGLEKTQVGLVANKLANEFNRPTLLVSPTTMTIDGEEVEIYGGSGRGLSTIGLDSLRELLLESGLLISAQGHGNAFGVAFKRENLNALVDYVNEALKDCSMESVYTVDFILNGTNMSNKFRSLANKIDVYKNLKVWGRGFDEPYIVLEDCEISMEPRVFKGSTLKLVCNGIDMIKFGVKDIDTDYVLDNYKNLRVTAVGKVAMSEYNGRIDPQLKITEVIFTEKKDVEEVESFEDWVF